MKATESFMDTNAALISIWRVLNIWFSWYQIIHVLENILVMLNIAIYSLLLLSGAFHVLSQPTGKALSNRQYSPDDDSYDFSQDDIKLASSNIVTEDTDSTTSNPNPDDFNEAFDVIDHTPSGLIPPYEISSCRKAPRKSHSIEDPQQGIVITCNGGRGKGDCKACRSNSRNICVNIEAPVCATARGTESCLLIWAQASIELTVEQTAELLPPVCLQDRPPQ